MSTIQPIIFRVNQSILGRQSGQASHIVLSCAGKTTFSLYWLCLKKQKEIGFNSLVCFVFLVSGLICWWVGIMILLWVDFFFKFMFLCQPLVDVQIYRSCFFLGNLHRTSLQIYNCCQFLVFLFIYFIFMLLVGMLLNFQKTLIMVMIENASKLLQAMEL